MASDFFPQKQEILGILKTHYGFSSLRPGQEEAIRAVLSGESAIVIMPTGGGKSLCYQLPAQLLLGVTIVISPLISLMKDQVDSLERVGIPATFINSSIAPAETEKRIRAVQDGYYKLLYIAPERFYNNDFVQAISKIKVSLFAVDEAHCISSWGHDFRPSYLRLKGVVASLGRPPVLALTATATPEVKADIGKQLGLENPEIIVTGFSRPNLQFGVIRANEARKQGIVMDVINSFPGGAGIIYTGTRARADQLLSILLENNIEAVGYHAGLEAEERKWVQENFMRNKARVIVATNAFGLGIDKPDVRFVVHYDMPGTVEAYYQEAGRAGRDNKKSLCLLLFNSRDRYLQEFFIKGDNPPPKLILNIYETLKEYGSDKVSITYSELAGLLSDNVSEMAVGTSLKILEKEGYISRARGKSGHAFLRFSSGLEEIRQFLGRRAKAQIEIAEKLAAKYPRELEAGWETNMEELAGTLGVKKDGLVRLFKKLAEKNMVEYIPPFRGTEINILKREDSANVKIDFSALAAKLKSAYDKLDRLEEYAYSPSCRPKYILDYFGDASSPACGQCDNCLGASADGVFSESAGREAAGLSTKLTQLETYDLYNKGLNIEDMAQARNLKPATIVNHLCYLLGKGLSVDVGKFVDNKKQKQIQEAAERLGKDKLAPIKEALGDDISWDEIKLALAGVKK